MAFTRHGHQIIGTIAEPRPEDMATARCGGPGMCSDCSRDANRLMPTRPPEDLYADGETMTKVRESLMEYGLTRTLTQNIISNMQNKGILFRETKR